MDIFLSWRSLRFGLPLTVRRNPVGTLLATATGNQASVVGYFNWQVGVVVYCGDAHFRSFPDYCLSTPTTLIYLLCIAIDDLCALHPRPGGQPSDDSAADALKIAIAKLSPSLSISD